MFLAMGCPPFQRLGLWSGQLRKGFDYNHLCLGISGCSFASRASTAHRGHSGNSCVGAGASHRGSALAGWEVLGSSLRAKMHSSVLLVSLLRFCPSCLGGTAHLFSALLSCHLFRGSFAASAAEGHGHRILSCHRAIYTTSPLSVMHSGVKADEKRLNKTGIFLLTMLSAVHKMAT